MDQPNLPLPWLLLSVAARSAIVLVVLLLGVRVFGKRDVGEMQLLDVALVLLLGNAVQNALTYGSGEIGIALVSAATLLAAERGLAALFRRFPGVEKKLSGEPTVVVVDGRVDKRTMKREGVTMEDLMTAARDQGLDDLSRVRLAVLEADGTISVVPMEHRA